MSPSPVSPRPRPAARRALALLVGAALAGGCHSSRTPAEARAERARAGGDVVIGVAWPFAAHPDIRFDRGLDLAVEEINAAGGIHGRRLRLRREDDGESVDQGRLVAQRLNVDPEVVAVIGHLQSYVTVPAAAIYDGGGIVHVSPTATDMELTSHGYKRLFRATFTDRAVGRQMAEFAAQRGYERVAIYYVRNAYGRGVSNAFEERAADLGVSVIARQSYDPGQVSERTFAGTLSDWKQLAFDAVFLAGEVPSAGTLVAAIRKADIAVPIIGVDAMSSPALMATGAAAAEGVVVPTVFHADEPRAEVRAFNEAYARRFGTSPDAGAALAYDAVRLIARAVERAGSSAPDAIARSLRALEAFRGVTGTFAFDSTGDLLDRPLVKMVVRDGRFVYLAETAGAPPRAVAAR